MGSKTGSGPGEARVAALAPRGQDSRPPPGRALPFKRLFTHRPDGSLLSSEASARPPWRPSGPPPRSPFQARAAGYVAPALISRRHLVHCGIAVLSEGHQELGK